MKALLLVVLVSVALAGCGVPDNLPVCNADAEPRIAIQATGWTADTAKALTARGWSVVHTDANSGLVVAECHASSRYEASPKEG